MAEGQCAASRIVEELCGPVRLSALERHSIFRVLSNSVVSSLGKHPANQRVGFLAQTHLNMVLVSAL